MTQFGSSNDERHFSLLTAMFRPNHMRTYNMRSCRHGNIKLLGDGLQHACQYISFESPEIGSH